MLVPPDRRRGDRRTDDKVEEPIDREAPRRREDRRDGARPYRESFVKSSEAPLPVLHELSLSLQGATWKTTFAPPEDRVTLYLQLPDMPAEVPVEATIQRRRDVGEGVIELYASFVELDVKTELALARFIESRSQLAEVLAEVVGG